MIERNRSWHGRPPGLPHTVGMRFTRSLTAQEVTAVQEVARTGVGKDGPRAVRLDDAHGRALSVDQEQADRRVVGGHHHRRRRGGVRYGRVGRPRGPLRRPIHARFRPPQAATLLRQSLRAGASDRPGDGLDDGRGGRRIARPGERGRLRPGSASSAFPRRAFSGCARRSQPSRGATGSSTP